MSTRSPHPVESDRRHAPRRARGVERGAIVILSTLTAGTIAAMGLGLAPIAFLVAGAGAGYSLSGSV